MSYKKNSIYLLVLSFGSLIGSGLGFLTHILIARNVSPDTLGHYSAIFFLTSTLAPLSGFGISQYLLKVFGEHGWKGYAWIPSTLKFVKFSTLATWLLLVIMALTLQETKELKIAAIIMSIIIISNLFTELVGSIFQLEEKYTHLSLWQLTQSVLKFLLLALIVYGFNFKLNEISISITFALTAVLMAPFALYKIHKLKKGQIKLKGHEGKIRNEIIANVKVIDIFKESWPFGVSGFFYLIYFQLSIVIINYYMGAKIAGNYSVAFTLITAATIFPGIIYQKFLLPKMHRWAHQDRALLYKTYIFGNYIMGAIGIVVAIALYLIAPLLIEHVFGEKYVSALEIINYLLFVIPVYYVASSTGATLITGKHMIQKIKYMGFTAAISIIATISLIPLLGVNAAAASLCISYTTIIALYAYANKYHVFNSNDKKTPTTHN